MIKLDLHVHSLGSPDAGLTLTELKKALAVEKLHCVAITDHNSTETAQAWQKELGGQIIVGEEVMSSEGELVGLFLDKPVKAGLSARASAEAIKQQGGLVYIPHPFETRRHGLQATTLDGIKDLVDVIEVVNGRTTQNRAASAQAFASKHNLATAASSDAHGLRGLGSAYTEVASLPTASTLVKLLRAGQIHHRRPHWLAYFEPSIARTLKRIGAAK